MTKTDAIARLRDMYAAAVGRACPRSRLAIQEYADASTAAADAEALAMAIEALQDEQRDVPFWVYVLWCTAAAIIGVACVIYTMY